MDPISAIGAVATVLQLADTALRLSKTIYSTASALKSATADLRSLGEDLEVFAQSLVLLHRLLNDNKEWYSDEVFLLTARILRDCRELYARIDGVLMKLEGKKGTEKGKGKKTVMGGLWRSVGIVVKEDEIRRLMERLRDLKGTLATVLMSLQLDLQLSLLKIASPSNLLRPTQIPLRPETLRVLEKAQEGGVKADDAGEMENMEGENAPPVYVSRTPTEEGVLSANIVRAPHLDNLDAFEEQSQNADIQTAADRSSLQPDEAEMLNDTRSVLHAFQAAATILKAIRLDRADEARKRAFLTLNRELSQGEERIGRACQFSDSEHKYVGDAVVIGVLRRLGKPWLELKRIAQEMTTNVVTQLESYSVTPGSVTADKIIALGLISKSCQSRSLVILDQIADEIMLYDSTVNSIVQVQELEFQEFEIKDSEPKSAVHDAGESRRSRQQGHKSRPSLRKLASAVGGATRRSAPKRTVSAPASAPAPTRGITPSTAPGNIYKGAAASRIVDSPLGLDEYPTAKKAKKSKKAKKAIQTNSAVLLGSSSNSEDTKPLSLWWRAHANLRDAAPELVFALDKATLFGLSLHHLPLTDSDWEHAIRSLTQELTARFPVQDPSNKEATSEADIAGILQIVNTIDKALGLSTAAVAWAGICVLLKILSDKPLSSIQATLTAVGKAASTVARYVVMGNLYTQYQGSAGLALSAEYEEALVDLATRVLWFLARGSEVWGGEGDGVWSEEDLAFLVMQIDDADVRCREFKVIHIGE